MDALRRVIDAHDRAQALGVALAAARKVESDAMWARVRVRWPDLDQRDEAPPELWDEVRAFDRDWLAAGHARISDEPWYAAAQVYYAAVRDLVTLVGPSRTYPVRVRRLVRRLCSTWRRGAWWAEEYTVHAPYSVLPVIAALRSRLR
jgi:hypothetical protein